jgi:hypothetical protein
MQNLPGWQHTLRPSRFRAVRDGLTAPRAAQRHPGDLSEVPKVRVHLLSIFRQGDLCITLSAAGEDPTFDVLVTIDFAA